MANAAVLSFDEHARRMHQITIGAERYREGVPYELPAAAFAILADFSSLFPPVAAHGTSSRP